nr:hypothetical protein BdHM001_36230 [Bdellovibrio sp. HM001]
MEKKTPHKCRHEAVGNFKYKCHTCGNMNTFCKMEWEQSLETPLSGQHRVAEKNQAPLARLGKQAMEIAISKGFDPRDTTDGDKLMLIVTEVAEAMEDVREGKTKLKIKPNGKPVGLPSELADIIIRTAQYATHLGIDLDEAVLLKMEYNKKRPHKHGGKKL